jgi:hypothetical protein
MLSSMHILSLKQGKLYGDRIPIEALPQGFGAFPGQIAAFCRSRFSSVQRRLAKGIPPGTSEPIAFDPGGKMPGPSGWLKRAG